MPIYNGIEFIDESVKSVLNQTYTNWELLIGVNGHPSNSNVFQKAKSFESNQIRVLEYPFLKGKAVTLNAMISECRYDYVAILDVDDCWMPEKLETQSLYMMMDYDVIGTRCVYFGDLDGVLPKLPIGDLETFNFKEYNPIINSSAVVKKELCSWNENGIEDYDLWLRLKAENRRFINCNEILVKHRIHRSSAFNSKGHEQLTHKIM